MKEGMDFFFNWMAKPMNRNDVDLWFRANNIQIEYSNLFKDFCFSLYYLMDKTYLGNSHGESRETKIVISNEEKRGHFQWCWITTITNFEKENIVFKFVDNDYDYFESFFFEVYYDQKDIEIRDSIDTFLKQLFTIERVFTKSDLEMYTDLYKVLERSLQS
jgi:hypothetical protein|tara:strand:- start:1789 stop:2271 length:483 start_codon:yes stop_codon:yes gene_type:complete